MAATLKYTRPRGDDHSFVITEKIAGADIPVKIRGALCEDGLRRSASLMAPRGADANGALARVNAYHMKVITGRVWRDGDDWKFIANPKGKNAHLITSPRRTWGKDDAGAWEEISESKRGSFGAGIDIIALAEASGWTIEKVMKQYGWTDKDRQMDGKNYAALWQSAENFLNRTCVTFDVAFGISKAKRYGLWLIDDLQ